MSRRLLVAMALLACVSTVVAVACGGGDDSAGGPAVTRTATAPGPTTTGNTTVDRLATLDYPAALQDGTTLGKADAKVTIGMFEDFTCSHCLEFTAQIEPGIVEQLVKTGKAKLEFHYFPLRGSSVPAMVAAQCAAEQNQFWEYGRRLFKEQAIANAQPTAAQAGAALTAAFSTEKFTQYAAELGLDAAKYAACLAGDTATARIAEDSRLTEQYGMKGTPTFVVNGKALLDGSPSTVADWVKLVDAAK